MKFKLKFHVGHTDESGNVWAWCWNQTTEMIRQRGWEERLWRTVIGKVCIDAEQILPSIY